MKHTGGILITVAVRDCDCIPTVIASTPSTIMKKSVFHPSLLIYALDMFHAVDDPKAFLTELHRVVKPDGVLIIDSGHQPVEDAKEKIVSSGLWEITEERDIFMRCSPLQ
ncbi:class I SAM-dependent methyltransferase [Methanoplanus endosymbiosus]|uniref:Class I SAM-dependent methyltransferase n=1 Tax=Methanoplanus endosymbiosus TaxID=33865 RepID=A0A9E7PKR7_9EURY|nr:class I SAM-dependent methyltransferase [Methanoplanus endosymbiosus]UUX91973.1 class I SAM-dependent methyltransferase [Methanoplanus endosymbiosus]